MFHKKKLAKRGNDESIDIAKVLYLTKEFVDNAPEGEVLDELIMNKM
jgi:hypothetical protein